jgi:hypothetical protein
MAKHRTKKQKQFAKHQFSLSWEPGVKRQNNIGYEAKTSPAKPKESAENKTQPVPALPIKREIVKSLILVSFILCLELVLYLAWPRLMASLP